jgi:hypothetical protein
VSEHRDTRVTESGEVRSSDLYLAAYVITSGVKLARLEFIGRRANFIFSAEHKDAVITLIEGWNLRTGTVEPQRYSLEIKALKSSVMNGNGR